MFSIDTLVQVLIPNYTNYKYNFWIVFQVMLLSMSLTHQPSCSITILGVIIDFSQCNMEIYYNKTKITNPTKY